MAEILGVVIYVIYDGNFRPIAAIETPRRDRNISFLHFELPRAIRLLGFRYVLASETPIECRLVSIALVQLLIASQSTSCLNRSPVGALGRYHSPGYFGGGLGILGAELILLVLGIAIISVYDKTGLLDLAKGLVQQNVRLLASGGTARMIREAGFPVE